MTAGMRFSRKEKKRDQTCYVVHWKDENNTSTREPASNITQHAIDVFENALKLLKRKKQQKRNLKARIKMCNYL